MEDWKPGGAGAGFPLAAFLHSFKCHFEPVECFDEIKFKSPFLLWAVVAQILHHILLCILDSSIPTNRAQTVGHCCIKHITSVKWDRRFVLPRGAFNAEHSHFWVSSLADKGLPAWKPLPCSSHFCCCSGNTSTRQICCPKWTSRNVTCFWRFPLVVYSSSCSKF